MKKWCARCETFLEEEAFPKNSTKKSGKATYCRDCSNAYRRQYYQDNKEKQRSQNNAARDKARKLIQDAKNRPCMDCGKSYPHYVMDLDHRDPSQKLMGVANMPRQGSSLEKIQEEINKCDVVCSNCHRERTHNPASVV